jgi:hypothetical protein
MNPSSIKKIINKKVTIITIKRPNTGKKPAFTDLFFCPLGPLITFD